MELGITAVLVVTFIVKGALPVQLSPLKFDPAVIENGSLSHIILDCPYTLDPGEEKSLVLKWYLNSHTLPLYQWIPPSPPQGLGSMRHKLNLDYAVTKDPHQRHRALFILRPSIEMSGRYTCKVSTLENEEISSSNLIIYIPPRYPAGDWRVTVFTIIEDATLDLDNLFICEMYLPHTGFSLANSTIYSPRHPAVLARFETLMNSSPTSSQCWLNILMFTILINSLIHWTNKL